MCEFKVFLDGKQIMEDVIYAKIEGNKILLKDIIGDEISIENATIIEVNVPYTKMILRHLS